MGVFKTKVGQVNAAATEAFKKGVANKVFAFVAWPGEDDM
jgi:lipoprotein NlpI